LLNRYEVEVWLDQIDLDRETVLVAIADERIIGTAVLQRQRHGWSRHVGEIRIVADPTFRRRGLGHALADAIMDLARQSGLEKLLAEMVSDRTEPIRVFSGSVSKPRPPSMIRSRTATATPTICW